jgi:hypothetical protein
MDMRVTPPGEHSGPPAELLMSHGPRKPARMKRLVRLALFALAYVVATAVMASPLINYSHLGSALYTGDARYIVWTLAWDNHALLNWLPLFDANVFYPAANSLAYNESMFGVAFFSLPVYAATRNPVLAYNVVWLASWILNGLAFHFLARRLVRDDLAAFVGGLAFAFSFYRMLHNHHLNLVWVFWIPLSLIALERWYRRPTWYRLLLLFVPVLFQTLSSWYTAVLVLLANAVFLVCLIACAPLDGAAEPGAGAGEATHPADTRHISALPWWRRTRTRGAVQLATAAVAGAVLLWPVVRHYTGLRIGSAAEAARFAADTASYLTPPENTWIGQWMIQHGYRSPRWMFGEATLYLGYTALALAGLGLLASVRAIWRRRGAGLAPSRTVFFVVIGALALGLSFGPWTARMRHVPAGWMPFDLFMWVPGVSLFRVPARFALLVTLSVSVFAAAGAAALHRRLGWIGRLLTLTLIPLMLSEWYVVRFPLGKPQPEPIPPVYRYLATIPARAVVSLPDYRGSERWWMEADYLYYSTAHWHPIINGYNPRGEPPDYIHIIGHMMNFAGSNSARTMRRLGVDYVVLHSARFEDGPNMLDEALHSDNFRLVARFGADYLFRVLPR